MFKRRLTQQATESLKKRQRVLRRLNRGLQGSMIIAIGLYLWLVFQQGEDPSSAPLITAMAGLGAGVASLSAWTRAITDELIDRGEQP